MPNAQPTIFGTVEEVTTLWRSLVNDTFPGLQGTQGRIATDSAPFTLPFLNSAIRTVYRKLRNEGVNFPIIDGWTLLNVPPVAQADPTVFVNVGYNGTNNGQRIFPTPYLPGDCYQIYEVRQRVTGSNLPFTPMSQASEGLPATYQQQWMGQWEARGFALWVNGATQAIDLMIRYLQFQPPINAPAEDFANTPIYIIDSTDVLAYLMAGDYGRARGANPMVIQAVDTKAQDAIDDMANEYIRRSQGVNNRRQSYQGGGSNGHGGEAAGSTGIGA